MLTCIFPCSYQSRQNAEQMGLYSIDDSSGVVRIGVDSTHQYSLLDRGRPSIRIESKETYEHGLFIADFLHMPPSNCGLWPACKSLLIHNKHIVEIGLTDIK